MGNLFCHSQNPCWIITIEVFDDFDDFCLKIQILYFRGSILNILHKASYKPQNDFMSTL